MFIYDMHVHVFPDKIAHKAADSIGGFYDLHMDCNGTVEQLIEEETACGVNRMCIYSVAMNVHSMHSINTFIHSQLVAHPDLFTGMAAIHPDYDDFDGLIRDVQAMGFKGFKIHNDLCAALLYIFKYLSGQPAVKLRDGYGVRDCTHIGSHNINSFR